MSRRILATREEREAHRDYARTYSAWIHSLEVDAEAGVQSAIAELAALRESNLIEPLPLDEAYGLGREENEDYADPIEKLAIVPAKFEPDHRVPIVDLGEVTFEELDGLTSHFGNALEWASRDRPNLLVMGARWLTIIQLLYPNVSGGKKLPARAMKQREFELRGVLIDGDLDATGYFYRRPLCWVSDSASLEQMGVRGYSLIKLLKPDLIEGMTCAELGEFKNDTRQATNKPLNDARDTFSGITNLTMRSEETRRRCRQAQM